MGQKKRVLAERRIRAGQRSEALRRAMAVYDGEPESLHSEANRFSTWLSVVPKFTLAVFDEGS